MIANCCTRHWYCASWLREVVESVLAIPEHRFCARDGYRWYTGPK